MENINVIDMEDNSYVVLTDDRKPIFQVIFYGHKNLEGLTQTEINQIVERIVAKYKLEKGGNAT